MAMKIFKITLIVIILGTLINAVRQDYHFPILQSLPLLGGFRNLKYEIAGIIIVCVTAWVCHRLRKNRRRANRDEYHWRQPRGPGPDYRPTDYHYRKYRY